MKTIGGYFKHCDDRSRAVGDECLSQSGIRGATTWHNFDVASGLADHASADRRIASILEPTPPNAFDAVYVDPQLTTFTSAWSAAFLRQLNRATKDDGILCLPSHQTDAQRPPAGWNLAWLERQFGAPAQRIDRAPTAWRPWRRKCVIATACFRRSNSMLDGRSVLDWWYGDRAGTQEEDVALLERRVILGPDELAQRCHEFLQNPGDLRPTATSEKDLQPGEALGNHCQTMTYSLLGVNYKAAILQYIFDRLLPSDRPLRIIDHGGGFGLVAMELLLNDPRIEKAVNCDPRTRNLVLASRVFQFHRDHLAARFLMHHGPSEHFVYDDRYDLVGFMGSLLYLPRASVAETLQRAWEALNRGGVLVVHENIKHRRYQRDYDRMFAAEEINGDLQPFGALHYFSSTSRQELSAGQVGNASAFRVVQKPE